MIATSGPPGRLPNIVVVFAESTFNPDWAFTLARPVQSALFSRQRDTQALSGLYVNTIGGGSWITEFESIVGVDSRLFGYSGYYTHSTLSPFVRRSIATYLRDKGYETSAYYSWAGEFYNARRAYANYGFDRFFDVGELGLHEFEGSDLDIATGMPSRAWAAPCNGRRSATSCCTRTTPRTGASTSTTRRSSAPCSPRPWGSSRTAS